MPKRRGHRSAPKYGWVDELMDSNARIFGPMHRMLPPHDPITGILLSIAKRDPRILEQYARHTMEDLVENPFYPISSLRELDKSMKQGLRAIKRILPK